MIKKGSVVLAIILIVVVLLVAGGVWYYEMNQAGKTTISSQPSAIPTASTTTTTQSDLNASTQSLGLISTTTKLGTIPQQYIPVVNQSGLQLYPQPIVFSPNMQSYAYGVREYNGTSSQAFVVFNGQEGKHYANLGSFGPVVFSPNSENIAYIASAGASSFVVANTQEGKAYRQIVSQPIFSPDSSHLVYEAMNASGNQASFVLVDNGTETVEPSLVDATSFLFAPNGKLSYVVLENAQYPLNSPGHVVFDGVAGKSYDHIWDPAISADGQSLDYGAKDGNNLYSVSIDINSGVSTPTLLATIGGTYTNLAGSANDPDEAIIFSPHRTRVTWEVLTGTQNNYQTFFVVDGKATQAYPFVQEPILPDAPSQGVIFMTSGYDAKGHYQSRVINGGVTGPIYQRIMDLEISPDQKEVSYFGEDNSNTSIYYLVVNGIQNKQAYGFPGGLVFSSDDSSYAFSSISLAQQTTPNPKVAMVAKGVAGLEYDFVSAPEFSADGNSVVYGARDGADLWTVVQPTH